MRSWAKAGVSVPRTGKPRPGDAEAAPISPGWKGARRELEQDPGGRGCPEGPWDTNRHLRAQGECPELPKGLQCAHAEGAERLREQLRRAGRRLHAEGAALPGA